MTWLEIDTWIVVIAILCAVSCSLLGNFLVLRKMSMMGDAISHAVLPGLAVAFILTETRASFTMFVGAAIVGLLTALFTQWVHSFGKVDGGAAMGVVFTSLFAIGLILIKAGADHVDLDANCVLYGSIELAPLDKIQILGWDLPRAAFVMGLILILNMVFVGVFFKELRISSFDPDLATTLGINAQLMHYLLMAMVAITTVAAFEAIGSILVIAMLIVPAAAAHLLTDRLLHMILASAVFAAISAGLGHLSAITLPRIIGFEDTNTAGMIATMSGVLFAFVVILAPRYGILSKALHRLALNLRILREDILGLLYRVDELKLVDRPAMTYRQLREALNTGPIQLQLALRRLRRSGRLKVTSRGYELEEPGRKRAQQIIRSHRLWETYLAEHFALPLDHIHAPAERVEHFIDQQMQDDLALETSTPTSDPHGKVIPPTTNS